MTVRSRLSGTLDPLRVEHGIPTGGRPLSSGTVVPTAMLTAPLFTDFFATRATVQATNINPQTDYLLVMEEVPDAPVALYERVASEPTHPGKIQSSDDAWWALSKNQTLCPTVTGVRYDGVTDDTQAHKDFAAVLNAFGGGHVICPRGGVTKIFNTGTVVNEDRLYPLQNINGLTYDCNGSYFQCDQTVAGFGVAGVWTTARIFHLIDHVYNFTLIGGHYKQPNLDTVGYWQSSGGVFKGIDLCWITGNGANALILNTEIYGGPNGIRGARNNDLAYNAQRFKGIVVHNLRTSDVFYPISAAKNCDSWDISNVWISRPGRAFDVYNIVDGFKVRNAVVYDHGIIFSTMLFLVDCNNAEGLEYNTLDGVDIDVKLISVPGVEAAVLHVDSVQPATWNGSVWVPGPSTQARHTNNRYKVSVECSPNTDVTLINVTKRITGGALDTVARGHIWDNVTFEVDINGNGGAIHPIRMWSEGENPTGDFVRGLKVSGVIRGSGAGGRPAVKLDPRGAAGPIVLDVACDGPVLLVNTPDENLMAYGPNFACVGAGASGGKQAIVSKANFDRTPWMGFAVSATQADVTVRTPRLPAPAQSAAIVGTAGHFALSQGGGVAALTGVSLLSAPSSRDEAVLRFTVGSGLTTGQAVQLLSNNVAAGSKIVLTS